MKRCGGKRERQSETKTNELASYSSQESQSELEDEKLIEAYAPKTEVQQPKVKQLAKDANKNKQKPIKQENSLK